MSLDEPIILTDNVIFEGTVKYISGSDVPKVHISADVASLAKHYSDPQKRHKDVAVLYRNGDVRFPKDAETFVIADPNDVVLGEANEFANPVTLALPGHDPVCAYVTIFLRRFSMTLAGLVNVYRSMGSQETERLACVELTPISGTALPDGVSKVVLSPTSVSYAILVQAGDRVAKSCEHIALARAGFVVNDAPEIFIMRTERIELSGTTA
jgi:hypothetical protein